MKHTPGPWTAESSDYNTKLSLICAGEQAICLVDRFEGVTELERIANARLICAAPELLEALESARQMLKHALTAICETRGDDPICDDIQETLNEAKRLLERAQGGAL